MFKAAFAALCLMLFAATLQAGSLNDLTAAEAAAEMGNGDEAIRLFSQAIAASDLSPADQIAARKGRGAEYTNKSMIADAFVRLDQARTLRNSAIADFTAAIGVKADDAALYLERAQARHLNGEYDQAVADFNAALKLDNTVPTLIQRGASRRAAGDYNGALADYSAALAAESRDPGIDAWQILSERGLTHFVASHYADAAADFDKSLTLGSTAHAGDVLWLPYQAAWLHIARARAGQNDAEELARNAAKLDLKQWPGTLIAFFLGQASLDQISPPSGHGPMGRGRECNLSFFTAQHALAKGDGAQAARLLQRTRAACNIHTVSYLAAGVELKRLAK